jgi:hypothetical protein
VVPCLARVWLEVGHSATIQGRSTGERRRQHILALCYLRNSPPRHCLTAIMLDAQWVYVGLIVLGLLCVAVLFVAAISR